MKLLHRCIPSWPKLAWVAAIPGRSNLVTVHHGPFVEIGDDWCIEGVWAGDYESGDFDTTDLVFGTGIRVREGRVVFVSSGTSLDRLWYCHTNDTWFVSNSLPALLAVTKLHLHDDYLRYWHDLRTIAHGLDRYVRRLPASETDLHLVYFHNLLYDGRTLRELEKPDAAPPFSTYGDYFSFLITCAERLGTNLKSRARKHSVVPLTSISSGYDSAAATVIATHAGCNNAVTLRRARSVFGRPDSGERIAKYLGVSCTAYDRSHKLYRCEEAFWAALGNPQDLNLSIFDYPDPLCAFFTGFNGGNIWARNQKPRVEQFARGDTAGLGFAEYRLLKGVFHCAVPFWGARHAQEIQRISRSKEMEPWTLYTKYDKPICRRILEEAGVPRGAFGRRKKATTIYGTYFWPFSPECRRSFRHYLRARKAKIPVMWWGRLVNRVNKDVLDRLPQRLRFGKRVHVGKSAIANRMLFQWSNACLMKLYHEP